MIAKILSEPGTIREANQDFTLSRDDDGIFILANGSGYYGREAAEELSGILTEKLWKIRRQASVEASSERIGQALNECSGLLNDWRVNRPGFQRVSVDLAASCIVEGHLFLGVSNSCGVLGLVKGQTIRISPRGIRRIAPTAADNALEPLPEPSLEPAISLAGPLEPGVGDWLMLFSEGLLMSQPLEELECLVPAVHQEADQIVEGIFRRASARYDGDDRTLVFLRFLPQDLRHLLADDVVINTEIDKTYSIPAWSAILVMILGFLISIFLRRFDFFDDSDS